MRGAWQRLRGRLRADLYAVEPPRRARRQLPPAPLGRRAAGLAVDVLGLGLVAFLTRGLVAEIFPTPAAALLAVADLLLGALWFAALPALSDGRTIGQRTLAIGVRPVVRRSRVHGPPVDGPPGAGVLLLRSVVLLVPFYAGDRLLRWSAGTGRPVWVIAVIGLGGVLLVLTHLRAVVRDPEGRGLHDRVAGTRVVDERLADAP